MGSRSCSELTSLRGLVDVLRAQQEEVAEVLEGAGPGRARVMVRLRAPLVTASEGGSEVLAKCTSLKGAKGKGRFVRKLRKGPLSWGARKA